MENSAMDNENPDYLEKVFRAIEEANREMNKYGVSLHWEFKIIPHYEPVTRSFDS